MSTALTKAAAKQFADHNLASAVARRVSRALAEGGWQRSIAINARNRSEGFVVGRMGSSSEVQIFWSHSTHLSPVERDSPEWNKARENEAQMWQFLRDRGYVVSNFGHIDVSKDYYTPAPEDRTPAVMRNLALKEELEELLAATKEAEEAFRTFVSFASKLKLTDAEIDTATNIADRLLMARAPFESDEQES